MFYLSWSSNTEVKRTIRINDVLPYTFFKPWIVTNKSSSTNDNSAFAPIQEKRNDEHNSMKWLKYKPSKIDDNASFSSSRLWRRCYSTRQAPSLLLMRLSTKPSPINKNLCMKCSKSSCELKSNLITYCQFRLRIQADTSKMTSRTFSID